MGHAVRKLRDSDTDQRNRFVELSTRLSELAASQGLRIVPFKDPQLPHFFASTFEQREKALSILALTVKLSEESHSRGEEFGHSSALIWSFCRSSKYTAASDFYDKIEKDNLVDVYNEHGQLIFANLLFYAIVEYSLEELYFRPWHELFVHQPTGFQEKLKEVCGEILKGPHGLRDLRDLGVHTVVATGESFRATVQPTYFSSLVQSGKIRGFICINRIVELLSHGNHLIPKQ